MWSRNPTSVYIYSMEMETEYEKDICAPMFVAASLTIVKIWSQTERLPVDEW